MQPKNRGRPLEALVSICARHVGPILFFAAMAIVWTWPLALHLNDALPGLPGDNYNFLWNLWWMRKALSTPHLTFFWTDYLFFPHGTSLVNHPHTALNALLAATVLKGLSLPAAQNVLIIGSVFANLAAMYALTWDITQNRRAALFGAMVFGTSPYFAAHLMGHFNLMSGWTLPLYALSVRRAMARSSARSAIAAGVLLALTAYTDYYYVVYLVLFTIAYVGASRHAISAELAFREPTPWIAASRVVVGGAVTILVASAVAIVVTGGTVFRVGPVVVSALAPQGPLTVVWIFGVLYVWLRWRLRIQVQPMSDRSSGSLLFLGGVSSATFVAGAAPLLYRAAELVRQGQYVSQTYTWRSAPKGTDLLAPLLGNPFHPLLGRLSSSALRWAQVDRIEAVAWIGVAPLLVFLFSPRRVAIQTVKGETRLWWAILGVFALWTLGPYLTVGGFDTGLKLPEILARFIPFVSNARIPGRAMVVVYLAIGVLTAVRLSVGAGTLGRPWVQWALMILLALDSLDAPIPLTPLDRPVVYTTLASAGPGAVCEAPFGFGDGLGGVGFQTRDTLYYATIHEHPIVGGYIGRMPPNAVASYSHMDVVARLLDLSVTPPLVSQSVKSGQSVTPSPCRYIVLRRDLASLQLTEYVRSLPVDLLATGQNRELYRLRDDH